jgi:protein-tyrosine phosphatase
MRPTCKKTYDVVDVTCAQASGAAPSEHSAEDPGMGQRPVFNRILIVCVGNICRSPIAEVVLRDKLMNRFTVVESAGLAALAGDPIDPLAESVLAEHGLTGKSHVARQVNQLLIEAADLVLAMEKQHVEVIHAFAPSALGKTFLLGRWLGNVEIPDPYRQPRAAFEEVYQLIDRTASKWRVLL